MYHKTISFLWECQGWDLYTVILSQLNFKNLLHTVFLFWIHFYSSFTGLYLLHQTPQDLKLDASPWFIAQTRDGYLKIFSALHFSWPRLQPFLGLSVSRKSKYCFSLFRAFSENSQDMMLHIWVGYFICLILFKANNRNNLKSLMVQHPAVTAENEICSDGLVALRTQLDGVWFLQHTSSTAVYFCRWLQTSTFLRPQIQELFRYISSKQTHGIFWWSPDDAQHPNLQMH